MSVVSRNTEARAFGALRLQYSHFARGTYPCSGWSTYPVNRFLMVTRAGKGRVASGDRVFPVRGGHSYFLPAGHAILVELDAKTEFYSIQSSLDLYCGEDLFRRMPGIVEAATPPAWAKRAEALFEEPNRLLYLTGLKALIYEIMSRFVHELPEDAWDDTDKWMPFHSVRERMTELAQGDVTVASLAAELGMRREVFSRKFTKAFGVSPKRVIDQNLMRKAMILLAKPDARVREVAARLGFSNEFYFSRFFRKHAGIPPSAVKVSRPPRGDSGIFLPSWTSAGVMGCPGIARP